MKKLKLEVESLRVESFRTQGPGRERRGTVRAHAGTGNLGLDHNVWTFGAYCEDNVVVLTNDCIYSDICSLTGDSDDCVVTP